MENREYSSFRDPAGYVYYDNNKVYRRVNKCYFKQYKHFISSGLYKELSDKGYIVSFKEIECNSEYIILETFKVPYISYPYEWCFDEYKDAALLTLEIEKIALEYGMTLKDASSYNVQIYNGRPIFIDILSFDFYHDGDSFLAYGQFCKHFFGPLLLMSYVNLNLNCLMRCYIDGIPLDVTNDILKGRGGLTSLEHVRLHSKSINKNNNNINADIKKISKNSLNNMIDMMIRQINKLNKKKVLTEWDNYYENTNYDDKADKSKILYVNKYLEKIKFKNTDIIYDLGGNDGKYSNIASKYGYVVSFDIDNNAVNRNYLTNKNILPLVLDLTNPSSGIGFGSVERTGINDRSDVKCVMALAIIHHMAISNNVNFDKISSWLSSLGKYLIIEYVPKEDSQVVKLLSTRKDIFDEYNINSFEKIFKEHYKIIDKNNIDNSKRVIYLMESLDYER